MNFKEPDSMINLVVHGSTPSKKNSFKFSCRFGNPRKYLTPQYDTWHKNALKQLKNAPKINESVRAVHLCFYSENKRKFDLSNKAESIMDLLVDAGILLDDNYEVVPELCLTYGGVDKDFPRCEIIIYVV